MQVKNKQGILLSGSALVLIVFLEFLFIKLELFHNFPYVGILFHLGGGMAVGTGTYYLLMRQLIRQVWYIKAGFIVGIVGLAAIGWEGFEWTFSHFFYHNNLQGSLDNTMGDLFVGVLGGFLAALFLVLNKEHRKTEQRR